ncbi:EF-P 5-aminopentanol modification-associated protein YfmF [Virgibacillus necropolis]|uniref:Peptidase M16 n=1 Tax=Virgibacillus necropolis TaxID=163877 RepID=A0A221MDE5_9BACI|nr:pitrilysin family protein [Virgibacillus necropolis]ASN05675.1 peptidase M16 [Virgibacillus necropolis]
MNQVNEKVVESGGLNVHLVPSKKFKTINFVVKFKEPLNRSTITKRAILPYILQQGTNKFPNRSELQQKLDDLYGAVLSIDGTKKGNFHIITFRLEIPNQRFLENESALIEDTMELLNEIIISPKSSGNGFDSAIVEREKETLKRKISSIMDDKMSYANRRLIDEMCENEVYQTHVHGYLDDLPELHGENLLTYYQSVLKENSVDFYVLGDFEENQMENIIKKHIGKGLSSTKSITSTNEKKKNSKPKTIIEKQELQQAKLHIGYRTNCIYSDKLYFALQVFNGLFGGFPNSKLFYHVREKNSLAYYAASRIESHKGLLFVFSGIAPKDFQQAKEIMDHQMDAMKNGDFTEDEISSTKELIVNQLLETLDHPQGIIELLYQQVVANHSLSPDDLITNIQAVSKQDVLDVGQSIVEDTTYLLTTKGEE